MTDDLSLPTIRLGRKDWPVPEFVWRDTKVLMPLIRHCVKIDWQNLTDSDMEKLGDLAYLTIKRGNGGLSREEFDALPMSIREITEALPVIAKQADLEAAQPGEQKAPPDLTGMT